MSQPAGVVLATSSGGATRLTLAGELDAGSALRLRALLDDEVEAGETVVLDLSRVTRVSADALAVLVQVHRRLRDSGGEVRLESLSAPVVRVLRISGLHRVFPVPSPAAARLRAAESS